MQNLNRRQFVKKASMSIAGTYVLSSLGYSAFSTRSFQTEEFVTTESTYGKLRGIRQEGVNIFKGIPYAGSVSGERRFRRPAKLDPWTGVRDALELGAPSMQDSRWGPTPSSFSSGTPTGTGTRGPPSAWTSENWLEPPACRRSFRRGAGRGRSRPMRNRGRGRVFSPAF